LRNAPTEEQNKLKSELPCFTIAGIFVSRSDDKIIKFTGLAGVDLDSAEGYDIPYLLKHLKKLPSIAYSGLSCRGKRIYCIVNLRYPDRYQQQYDRLIKSFSDWGLPMGDDCHRRLSQPRYVSWNSPDTEFYNHNAEPYGLLVPEKKFHYIKRTAIPLRSNNIPANAFDLCVEWINRKHQFINSQRHNYILQLARLCNLKGIPEEQTFDGCIQFQQSDFTRNEIKQIVVYIYTKHSDSFNRWPFVVYG
jgi:hypothetical protein